MRFGGEKGRQRAKIIGSVHRKECRMLLGGSVTVVGVVLGPGDMGWRKLKERRKEKREESACWKLEKMSGDRLANKLR